MKEILKQLIDSTPPKQVSQKVKRNPELFQWVNQHHGRSIAEKIFNALRPNEHLCRRSEAKKFASLQTGYRFCGPASTCQCANEAVSEKVSANKKGYSDEQKLSINAKRASTNIKRYGVANIGQTESAKSAHTLFYQTPELVNDANARGKATRKFRHGAENFNNRNKAIETNLERYGVENPTMLSEVVARAKQTKKERYEPYHLAKLNYSSFIRSALENFQVIPQISKDEYIGVGTRPEMQFKCAVCSHVFAKRFDYAAPPICKICNPTDISFKSKPEIEILDFCRSLGLAAISGDRSVINPYEIDIWLPEKNVGIEFCGLYWHSEISGKKSWNYHYRKYKAASDRGIQLLTIFSDEWERTPDIVKSSIRSKVGAMNEKIFARKCRVVSVASKDASEFYAATHLQGPPKMLPLNYGLSLDGELVSCMSFRKDKGNCFELSRFSTRGQVVGAASRLLNAFQKDWKGCSVISFSNNRYSEGNIYKRLGFEHVSDVPPMQEYVSKYQARVHKRGIGKYIQEFKTEGVTEWGAARAAGFDRIWDCGKKKWVLTS